MTRLVRAGQAILGVTVVALWELLVRLRVIDQFYFSQPSDIAARIGDWFSSGKIFEHLQVTLIEAMFALLIGTALGLSAGFLLARIRFLADILDPYLKVLNAIPRIVLAPIFLLWFGLGIWSKVAFGVSLTFFAVFFNTYHGVRDVNAVLVDNVRMLGAKESQLMWHVFLPSALSWIFSSLHMCVGFAVAGAVVGEYLGSSHGMGYLISQAEGVFDTTGVFAGITVLSVVVVVVDIVVHRIESYLLKWKPETQHSGRPGFRP